MVCSYFVSKIFDLPLFVSKIFEPYCIQEFLAGGERNNRIYSDNTIRNYINYIDNNNSAILYSLSLLLSQTFAPHCIFLVAGGFLIVVHHICVVLPQCIPYYIVVPPIVCTYIVV